MEKAKDMYMVVGVLEDRSQGKKEVVGYRVLELKTGDQKNIPKSYLVAQPQMQFTNLKRNPGNGELEGTFHGYPVYEINTGEILENKSAKIVVFEGIEDSGISKKKTYRVMDIRGKAEWLTPENLIRFYQGDIANMSIVTPAEGKRYLRRLTNHYIPVKSSVPDYTQKAFENKGAEGEMVSHWLVRLIKQGERYGLDSCLVNDKAETLVEFIDANSLQFVSRYNLSTIKETDEGVGLNLNGEVPPWRVTKETMADVREWLKSV